MRPLSPLLLLRTRPRIRRAAPRCTEIGAESDFALYHGERRRSGSRCASTLLLTFETIKRGVSRPVPRVTSILRVTDSLSTVSFLNASDVRPNEPRNGHHRVMPSARKLVPMMRSDHGVHERGVRSPLRPDITSMLPKARRIILSIVPTFLFFMSFAPVSLIIQTLIFPQIETE